MYCNNETKIPIIIPVRHVKLRGKWHERLADVIIMSNFHYWLRAITYVHPGTFSTRPRKSFLTKVNCS